MFKFGMQFKKPQLIYTFNWKQTLCFQLIISILAYASEHHTTYLNIYVMLNEVYMFSNELFVI